MNTNRTPARRPLRLPLRLLCAALASVALAELGMRWILFGASFDGTAAARALRRPNLFADAQRDDLYWELQTRFLPPVKRSEVFAPDALLGWTNDRFDSAGRVQVDEARMAGRRPVLLYGDSYAACATPPRDCFPELLARSDFGSQLAMLDLGVGGYGLDQVLLAMRATLGRFEAQNPLVVVGIMVDDDLDRCSLAYRSCPKPRFELVDGALALRPPPTMDEYWSGARFLGTSFLWRYVVRNVLPAALADAWDDVPERTERAKALARAVLEAALDELEARKLQHLVVLFFNDGPVLDPALTGWREPLVREVLVRRGTPHVDTRAPMLAASGGERAAVERLFGGSPAYAGHFNAEGNAVAFRAFESAFQELFGVAPQPQPLDPAHYEHFVTFGDDAAARFAAKPREPFTEPDDTPRVILEVGAWGPSEVHYRLRGRAQRFEARARFVPDPAASAGSVRVSVWADGIRLFESPLLRGDPPLGIQVNLTGHERMFVRVDDGGDGNAGDAVVLTRLRLE